MNVFSWHYTILTTGVTLMHCTYVAILKPSTISICCLKEWYACPPQNYRISPTIWDHSVTCCPTRLLFYVTVCECHIALKATWLDLTWRCRHPSMLWFDWPHSLVRHGHKRRMHGAICRPCRVQTENSVHAIFFCIRGGRKIASCLHTLLSARTENNISDMIVRCYI